MRKLNELNSEEFFDVIYAISPLLNMIINMGSVQGFIFKNFNDSLAKLRNEQFQLAFLYQKEKSEEKKIKLKARLDNTINEANKETSKILSNDILTVIPKIASKEYRQVIYEIISIMDCITIEDVKKMQSTDLTIKIQSLITDTDFKSFLSYAEKSAQTELLSTPQNLQGL